MDRTVRKWADQIVNELQRTVFRAFVNAQAGQVVLSSPRVLMPTSLNPLAIGYRATLERYAEHVPAPYRLQALGYLEEFNARIELANFYLRELLWSGFFALLIILGLLPAAILQLSSQARVVVAILTAMLLLVYGLMFAYIRYVFTMAQAALRTLRRIDHDLLL